MERLLLFIKHNQQEENMHTLLKIDPLKFLAMSIMIALITACAVFSGRETSGEYVDDATITSKIKSDFLSDPKLRANIAELHVETFQGVVQLSGFVDNESVRERADRTASRVHGVKSVRDNLQIRHQED
jgi:hypothetical protein